MAELGCTKRSNLLTCVSLSPVVYGDKRGIGCRVTLHFEIYITLGTQGDAVGNPIDTVLETLEGTRFTTDDFISEFRKHYPQEWQDIVAKYGAGGKGSGSYYTANVHVGKQLSARKDREELTFVAYISSPDGWGSPFIALWERNLSGTAPVRFSTSLAADLTSILKDQFIPETERNSQILARIGQGKFRAQLVHYWKGCAVTQCDTMSVLKASHIKPWKDSDNRERLDQFNGLLLIPNLDALFDQGLISFANNGAILVSDLISRSANSLGVHERMKVRLTENHEKYMAYHRANIFIQGESST